MDLRSLGMAIRSGELSPAEHVADALDRLRADAFNAVVVLDEERALADAAALTAELARRVGDADPVFLSAGDEATARVYVRAGFARVGTTCAAEPAG